MELFEKILASRGLKGPKRDAFLYPNYDAKHDPFLLPDMAAAVDRLILVRKKQQKITIYGDYDIDGLTATAVLLDALNSFGFKHVDAFIPNRFVEGYGLTVDAINRIAAAGANVIITVDCGSLSEKEIIRANELGVNVIVTDHHNVADKQPPAVAVINPKRYLADYPDEYDGYILKSDSKMQNKIYPFLDLAGVGVAFKLVQAMQQKMAGLPAGQEKWLLDLVALGTVCDVVNLTNENRANVYWGLKVLAKTQRPGLKALMDIAGVNSSKITTKSLGFALGPRMNAAGRLETAQHSLDLLTTKNFAEAYDLAQKLDVFNTSRKLEQQKIYTEAVKQAEEFRADHVLVVSGAGWSHGIIGIVAAKLMEQFHKPIFVLEEMGDEAKGSARSYGDFSAADAIRYADAVITKGGGHKFAAGVTMPTQNIAKFREMVNEYYRTKKMFNQQQLLLAKEDVSAALADVNEELVALLETMEPFGNANPQPILMSKDVLVTKMKRMGADSQHVKLELDDAGIRLEMLAFNAPEHYFVEPGERVTVWYQPDINEWQGRRTVEGRLLRLEISSQY
ncbi:MAG: single-stranded-DNA-specific exonuclease [Patescibacteria group bacterium]|nr:single-stranded-DNA-specific exonuclease [Patescibacteria group bacterium]